MRHWIALVESAQETTYSFSEGPATTDMVERIRQQGDDVYERIPYFLYKEAWDEKHFIAWRDGVIVGVGGVQVNPYNEHELWGKFVGVDERYREQGIGGRLIRQMMKYAEDNDMKFVPSSFTQMGEERLKPIVDRHHTTG